MGRSWPRSFSITPCGDFGGGTGGSVGYFDPLEVLRAKHAVPRILSYNRTWWQIYRLNTVTCNVPGRVLLVPPLEQNFHSLLWCSMVHDKNYLSEESPPLLIIHIIFAIFAIWMFIIFIIFITFAIFVIFVICYNICNIYNML